MLTIRYLLLALLYLIAYTYSIEIAPWLAYSHNKLAVKINNIHESCLLKCDATKNLIGKGRGSQYYIGKPDSADNSCLITFWTLSHFILYSVIGFLLPDMFWQSFIVGVGFEIYEKYKYNCEDYFDIIANSAGFGFGWFINKLIY